MPPHKLERLLEDLRGVLDCVELDELIEGDVIYNWCEFLAFHILV